MSDNIAIVRFEKHYVEDGVSSDGLPHYRDSVKIIKSVPPHTEINRVATDYEMQEFAAEYELFQKEQRAMKQTPTEGGGFPLALWPAVTAAELRMLSARDITTIEQLARLADRGDPNMPGEIRELAARAKQMASLSKEIGQFEEIIRKRDGELEVLREQITELRAAINQRDATILALKQIQIQPGGTPHG